MQFNDRRASVYAMDVFLYKMIKFLQQSRQRFPDVAYGDQLQTNYLRVLDASGWN